LVTVEVFPELSRDSNGFGIQRRELPHFPAVHFSLAPELLDSIIKPLITGATYLTLISAPSERMPRGAAGNANFPLRKHLFIVIARALGFRARLGDGDFQFSTRIDAPEYGIFLERRNPQRNTHTHTHTHAQT